MTIYDVDDYVLKRHQGVADWVYTKFDRSPYGLAFHLFSMCVMAKIVFAGLLISKYDNLFSGVVAILFGGFFYGLFCLFSWSAEEKWKKDPDYPPIPTDIFFPYRVMFFVFLLIGSRILIVTLLTSHRVDLNILLFTTDLCSFLGINFLSCLPPTKAHQHDESFADDLVPDAT